jgi:hypothetical protein
MSRWNSMRIPAWWLVIALICATGCATKSTVQTRKKERPAAYAALPAELKHLVDQGQIQMGLDVDSVYIAWGRPAEVLPAGESNGELVTWHYPASTSDNSVFWRYHEVPRPGGGFYLVRHLDEETALQEHVAAELEFREGALQRWRLLPSHTTNSESEPVGERWQDSRLR